MLWTVPLEDYHPSSYSTHLPSMMDSDTKDAVTTQVHDVVAPDVSAGQLDTLMVRSRRCACLLLWLLT